MSSVVVLEPLNGFKESIKPSKIGTLIQDQYLVIAQAGDKVDFQMQKS